MYLLHPLHVRRHLNLLQCRFTKGSQHVSEMKRSEESSTASSIGGSNSSVSSGENSSDGEGGIEMENLTVDDNQVRSFS